MGEADLAAENQALKERVKYLETELGMAVAEDGTTWVRRTFKLAPAQARIAIALAKAYPRPVQNWALELHLTEQNPKPGYGALKVQIYNIREVFGHDEIITVHGLGYSMAEKSTAMILATLRLAEHAARRVG